MTPSITWKGGGPLMTAGGLIGGSDKCCCENPPPPFCGCPDFCIYRIEVVSPGSLAAKSSIPALCGSFADIRRIEAPVTALPSDLCNVEECQPWIPLVDENVTRSFVELAVAHRLPGLYASVGESFVVTGFPEWSGSTGYITFGIAVYIGCRDYEGTVPSFYLQIRTSFLLYQNNKWTDGSSVAYSASKVANFDLTTSACETIGGSRTLCGIGGRRARYITTPLTFDASWDTTSLGNYQFDYIEGAPQFFDPRYKAFLDEILASFSATFRITSRPNCKPPITCNCAAPLGGMYVDLGNLKSATSDATSSYQVNSSIVDFVYMYDQSDQAFYWQGPFGFYEYRQNDSDGPQDGNGKFTRTLWSQRAELYCDVIDGVAQWFVLFTSFRDIYDEGGTSTHRSYDQWAGKIDCFAACEDLDNYIEADQPVPMGEPYDIEYLGRTTEAGYLECEPPPRLTIRFTQIVNC